MISGGIGENRLESMKKHIEQVAFYSSSQEDLNNQKLMQKESGFLRNIPLIKANGMQQVIDLHICKMESNAIGKVVNKAKVLVRCEFA